VLQLFRTNQFSIGILLLLYAVILKIGAFFVPQHQEVSPITGYLYGRVMGWIPDSTIFQSTLAISLVFLGGFLMTVVVIRQRLEIEVTLFSGVFYILVSALILNYLHPSGAVMGAIFLILSLLNLLNSPNKVYNAIFLFNTGLFIGMASLFYWSFWIFIIWAILSVFQLLGARFKEAMMVITGFIIPFFYQGLDYFRNNHFADFWHDLIPLHFGIEPLPLPHDNLNEWIGGGLVLILLLITLAGQSKNIKKKQVIIRRKINAIYWMIPFSIIAVFIQANGQFSDFFLLSIPISVMLAFQFTRIRSGSAELLHIVLVAIAIYLSFSISWA